jgi:hypothetical protein
MNARVRLVLMCLGLTCLAAPALVYSQPVSPKAYLLQVGKGQAFTDIGSDDKTTPVPLDANDRSKGWKVVFSKGDSVGDKSPKIKNWKPFKAIHIAVSNPSDKTVNLALNLLHSGSTNFQTRVLKILEVPPGDNVLVTQLDSLTNVNRSAPNLEDVRKWYLSDEDKVGPTLIFRDIWLAGGDPAATSQETRPASDAPTLRGRYRIRGKVGNLDVDLTLEPLDDAPAASPAKAPSAPPKQGAALGDPSRIKRIRSRPMPEIDHAVSFDTPAADAICSVLEVFPPDNPWNTVIEDWPLHANSKNIVASAGVDKPLRYNADMGFILIPSNQPRVEVKLGPYSAESDLGPYPVPNETPIEGFPLGYPGQSLDQVQRKNEPNSDRHAVVVDPAQRMLYEFYQLRKTDAGWTAAGAAIFDLKSNKLRPDGWTSTDAAGLPIFPAVVRYDELQRGIVEHAMRFTVVKTRRAYVYPATHYASPHTDENLPRMGERYRLRKNFDISGFTPEVQAILKGLKKYGMYVADNGQDWAISVAPDRRIRNFAEEFRKIKGGDFEVVEAPAGYEPPE